MTSPNTVIIVEDRQILAESLGRALQEDGIGVHLVMEPSLDAVARAAREAAPVAALVALGFGSGNLTEQAIGALTDEGIPTLVMTGGANRLRLAGCIAEGAVGIIDKGSSFAAVSAMVSETAGLNSTLDRVELYSLQDELRRYRAEMAEQRKPFERLSGREREVLRHLTDGLRAEEIAATSFVSVSTVRSQIRAILTKLGVSSQLAAVAMANRARWFDSPILTR